MARYQKLVIATLVAGYLLLVAGGIVRVTGTGLGCGAEWPLCNGAVVPSFTLPSAIAFSHRLLSVVVALLTLGLIVTSWRAPRASRAVRLLSVGALVLVLAQAGIGAVATLGALSVPAVTLHLGMAEAYLGVLVLLGLAAFARRIVPAGRGLSQSWSPLGKLAIAASVAVFVVVLTGAYTALSGAGLACSDWPLCNGHLIPTGTTPTDIHLIHRWLALIATLLVLGVALQARRARADSLALMGLAMGSAVLMITEVFVGAVNVWLALDPIATVAHLAVATIVWGTLLMVVVVDRMIPVGDAAEKHPLRAISKDYAILTKPGVMTLLLVTTLGAMLFAQAGLPPLRILFWTLIGGALASGGAAALNHYLDRDIDIIMARTRGRPVPGGRLMPVQALIFGVTLSVLSVYLLAVFVNALSAVLALLGNLFYVFIYTKWLKRATPQNIVIGGIAGSIPPLVGWAAVTGKIGLPAVIMFLIIFLWTPPHFWALALFRKRTRDYAAAGVPMMPGVKGEAETRKQIFIYTILLVLLTLSTLPIRANGVLYLLVALTLGAMFIYKAVQLLRKHAEPDRTLVARSLFMFSNWYLAAIFAAMVIDRLVGI